MQLLMRISQQASVRLTPFYALADLKQPGTHAEGQAVRRLDLHRHLVTDPANTVMVKVAPDDDSMMDAGILPASALLVNQAKASQARSNDIVVALMQGEYVVKRLYKHAQVICLLAENKAKAYPPISFPKGHQPVILGVVEHVITACR